MNFLDLLILIPVAWGAWFGFRKGLIIEVFTLLALLVGSYAGIHFSDLVADALRENLELDWEYLPAVCFLIVFLAVGALVYFGGKAIEKVVKVTALTPLNKALGASFGGLKFLFFVSLGVILMESFDKENTFVPEDTKEESLLYTPLKDASKSMIPKLEESLLERKTSALDL